MVSAHAFVFLSLNSCSFTGLGVQRHPALKGDIISFSFGRLSLNVNAIRMREPVLDSSKQPAWLQDIEVSEWNTEHVEDVSLIRTSDDGMGPRAAYLMELDKAAKGKSNVLVCTAATKLLHDDGVSVPMPDCDNSQELKNMYEMVQMGMLAEETLREAVANKRSKALDGRSVVGAVDLTCYTLSGDSKDKPAYISNMIVREQCRGNGLGFRLLDSAEQLARQQGATHGTLHVHDNNHVAMSLYENAGFSRVNDAEEATAHARSVQALVDLDLSEPQSHSIAFLKKLL